MEFVHVALILATFLCSLVAGFLFAFAVVVMAGIGNLRNREFVRAFQAMDGIIQNNQPVFMVVWLGSVVALVIAAALGVWHLDAPGALLLIVAALAYLLGVQLPTFAINVPLNNRLQSLNVDTMDETALRAARESFEGRWNRSNASRTAFSCLVSFLLIVVVLRY
jgi:uncharacterized membrane protein